MNFSRHREERRELEFLSVSYLLKEVSLLIIQWHYEVGTHYLRLTDEEIEAQRSPLANRWQNID